MGDKHKGALTFIFITLLIDFTGIGIIIPIIPGLIEELIHGNISDASKYGGWLTFAYAFMQFICAPVLGGLSDKYGRRPVLLASLFGMGVDYIFLAFAPTIFWLFIGRILSGVTGASMTAAMAYIADVSPAEKRAQNFGLLGMAFGIGFIAGPAIAAVASKFGIRAPFYIAAALSLLNCIYGYFVLPESLSKEHRRPFTWARANPLGSLRHISRYGNIYSLMGACVLVSIAGHAMQSTWTYFTMLKFEWTEEQVGYSLSFVGLLLAIVQGGLIRIVLPKIGQQRAIYIGFVLYIIGFVLFGLASTGWMMYAILVPYCLGGISGPSLQGIMSNNVPPTEQGELQGALASMISITNIIGPLLMTGLFYFFTNEHRPFLFPGAPFFLGALLMTASLFLVIRSFRKNAS